MMSNTPTYHDSKCACFWEYVVPFTRFWGIITAVVMSGVGVDLTYYGHKMGIYVLLAALVVFFLEITWAVTLFLQVCLRHDDGMGGGCLRCWDGVLWCGSWKKGVLYAIFGAVILLRPHRLWLSPASGVMLLLLASLYFLLTFKIRREAKETLLQGREESYDRFDEMPEVLDDTLPEPLPRRGYTDAHHHIHIHSAPSTSGATNAASTSRMTTAVTRTHALVDGFGDQEIILEIWPSPKKNQFNLNNHYQNHHLHHPVLTGTSSAASANTKQHQNSRLPPPHQPTPSFSDAPLVPIVMTATSSEGGGGPLSGCDWLMMDRTPTTTQPTPTVGADDPRRPDVSAPCDAMPTDLRWWRLEQERESVLPLPVIPLETKQPFLSEDERKKEMYSPTHFFPVIFPIFFKKNFPKTASSVEGSARVNIHGETLSSVYAEEKMCGKEKERVEEESRERENK